AQGLALRVARKLDVSREDGFMAKPGRKTKPRVRTQHPGVKIIWRKRKSGVVYLGRWRERVRDKDDKDNWRWKWKEISLTKEGYSNEQERIAWAKSKSAEIARHKQRRAGEPVDVATAVDNYFATQVDLRPATVDAYTY